MKNVVLFSVLSVALFGNLALANAAVKDGGLGEAAVCYYGGQAYSQGGQHTETNGDTFECQSDGTWKKTNIVKHGPSAPPVAKLPTSIAKAGKRM